MHSEKKQRRKRISLKVMHLCDLSFLFCFALFPLLPPSLIFLPSLFTELCIWSQEVYFKSVHHSSQWGATLDCLLDLSVYCSCLLTLFKCVCMKERKKVTGRSSVWYAHLISPIKSSGSSSQGEKKSWLLFNSFTTSLYKPFNSAVLLCWFLLGSAGRELSFALLRGTQQQLLVLWSLN